MAGFRIGHSHDQPDKMNKTENTFDCDCGSYTFPLDVPKPYGRHTCPECRSTWTVTRIGLQAKRDGIKVERTAKRDYTEAERLYAAMQPDGSITCSGCGHVTELLTGREGSLSGKRGVYCVLCLATKPIKVSDNEVIPKRGNSIKVLPIYWNTTIQRIEAEHGIMAVARSIASGSDPLNYGNMLAGANWSGLRVRSNPDPKLQNGDPNPAYRNMINRTPDLIEVHKVGSFAVAGASPWFATATIHPSRCGCLECARYSVAVRKVTIRLPRAPRAVVLNGHTLATVTPKRDGIGVQAIRTVDALTAREKREPIKVQRCAHYERTLPRASAPAPDPALRLPDLAASYHPTRADMR